MAPSPIGLQAHLRGDVRLTHLEVNRDKPVDNKIRPFPLSSPRARRYVDIRYTNASTYPSSRPISFSKSTDASVESQSRTCSTVNAPRNLLSSRSPRKNRNPCGTMCNNMKPSQERTSRKSVAPPRTRLHRRPQPKQPSTRILSQQHSDPRPDSRFTSSPQCKPYLL